MHVQRDPQPGHVPSREWAKTNGLELDPFTVHDLWRTGSTILNELGFNSDWIEKCLAYEDGRSSRGIYNKAEHAVRRRHMPQEWADMVGLGGGEGTHSDADAAIDDDAYDPGLTSTGRCLRCRTSGEGARSSCVESEEVRRASSQASTSYASQTTHRAVMLKRRGNSPRRSILWMVVSATGTIVRDSWRRMARRSGRTAGTKNGPGSPRIVCKAAERWGTEIPGLSSIRFTVSTPFAVEVAMPMARTFFDVLAGVTACASLKQ